MATATVPTERRGAVLIARLDHAPVNALALGLRTGLVDAIKAAKADAAIKAIVITGNGRAFSAGADITEFAKGRLEPFLWDVINQHRSLAETGRRRDQRPRARWRARGGARLPLSRRLARREATRPARSEDRHHSRRRRHATPAASDRRRGGARHDRVRQSDRCEQGPCPRPDRQASPTAMWWPRPLLSPRN